MEQPEDLKTEQPAEEEMAREAFARLPSTLPDIGVDLIGFAPGDFANSVGLAVNSRLHAFGKLLNLKRLVQVIVSYNYNETLAGLDRGTEVPRPLAPTNNGIAVGIAMTPTVLRDGEPRSIMVLNAAYMAVFGQEEENSETAALAEMMTATLAHECAHVHDLDVRATCLPDIILKTRMSFRDGILFGAAFGCWDEYIACRLSAFIGGESTMRALEDTFISALDRAKGRADLAIRQYRMHADIARVTLEVSEEYGKALEYASYLLGQIDGTDRTVQEAAPKALEAVDRHPYFKPFFSKLHDELRALHATYGKWESLEVYEPLKQLVHELLIVGGVDIQARPDGDSFVEIPFTSETMPSLEERKAYFAAKLTAEGESA